MKSPQCKTIYVGYYAFLREKAGTSQEAVKTAASTPRDLYKELCGTHNFRLSENLLRVAINNVFSTWQSELQAGDHVAFIPPVSGG